ncbi:tripartite tricarboxylate transporter substrate binding protein [Vineibacter terrae]|uniref:tripartite tricarboxylate transporter substrate binding protein n=1 Tax=Vineibacter terrae TaxID=2586908 RepID=UPI002E311A02|nr:tripartite tricarboxylate transporter substrate binding protein [Vineibacter terrae]HEX2891013.1 tripartite tricarboxylate transporter substrate binding protein [Vineibacter terrae]
MPTILSRRTVTLAIAAAAMPAIAPAVAQTDDWPKQPIKFIVPFPPGGTVDPVARILQKQITDATGWNIIVDNRPGAGGSIGTAAAAKSPADGYTWVVVFDTHAVNPSLLPNMTFDTLKDLAPVMLVGTSPMAVVTPPGRPFKTFGDVVTAAKAKPDTITYGSIGNGSLGHLTLTLVQQAGDFRIVHVPYKGGGPMTQDVIAGQIDLAIGTVALLTPQIQAGKVRALAVTGDKRSPVLPDVPSLAEQGFPNFSALAWWGVLAPTGTPKAIQDRMHAELAKALAQPAVRKQLGEQLGMDLVVSTPAQFNTFLGEQVARWGKVVRDNNIKPD